jgi:hypothetical protein
VDVSGSSTLNLFGGGIFMNSDEVCGYLAPNCPSITITGGAGINSAATVDNIDQNSTCTYPPVPENINADPVIIPEDVYWPDVPPECSTAPLPPFNLGKDPVDNKDEYLIYPGFYTDFPQATLIPNNKHIFMSSGVYCIDPPMDQDLSWNALPSCHLTDRQALAKANTHLQSDGVTLYIKIWWRFSFNINNPIFLDASTGDLQVI